MDTLHDALKYARPPPSTTNLSDATSTRSSRRAPTIASRTSTISTTMSVIADKMRKTWSSAKWYRARGSAESKEPQVESGSMMDSSALTLAGCSITLTAFGYWPVPAPAPTATISRAATTKRVMRAPTSTGSATPAMQPVPDAWAVLILEMHGIAAALAPFTAASIPPPVSGLATPPDSPIMHDQPAPTITAADRVLLLVARAVRHFLTRIVDPQLLELWAGCADEINSCPGRTDGDNGLPRPAVEHLGPFFRCAAMAMVAIRPGDVGVLSTHPQLPATPLVRVLRARGHVLITDLARLLHLDPADARWTHAVDWDQLVVGLASRWFMIKAVCPFAALVEPQPGAGMDPRLCVVDGGEEAEVVEYCVVPALVDLAVDGVRGVVAKARVVGAPMGMGMGMGVRWSESESMSNLVAASVE